LLSPQLIRRVLIAFPQVHRPQLVHLTELRCSSAVQDTQRSIRIQGYTIVHNVCVVQPYHYHVHVITTRQPVSSRSPWHPEDEERTLFLVKATAVLRSNATGAEAAAVVVLDFSLDSQAISQPRNRPPSSVPTSRPSTGT